MIGTNRLPLKNDKFNIKESAVNDGFSKMDNSNVFIGIIIGLIAAY
jgi:PTS system N-acetylglucosamine-specific IIC component